MAPTSELTLDADGCGFTICPECKIHIHCGNVGLSNHDTSYGVENLL